MHRYIITLSMRGYMPESDPFVFECDPDIAPQPQVLEYLSSEVERMADQDAMAYDADHPVMVAWDQVYAEIETDREHAADFDDSGFLYDLPNSLVIDASLKSVSELIDLGYAPDIDGCPDSVVIDREGSSLDFDDSQWTPADDEWSRVAAAINFQAAYGRN